MLKNKLSLLSVSLFAFVINSHNLFGSDAEDDFTFDFMEGNSPNVKKRNAASLNDISNDDFIFDFGEKDITECDMNQREDKFYGGNIFNGNNNNGTTRVRTLQRNIDSQSEESEDNDFLFNNSNKKRMNRKITSNVFSQSNNTDINLFGNKLDRKQRMNVKELDYKTVLSLLENNITIKAEDVVLGNKNMIIFDKHEKLREFWAFNAMVDEDNWLHSSINNLATAIVQEYSFTKDAHEEFLSNMFFLIIQELTKKPVDNVTDDASTILSLYNGFLCSDAIYNAIQLTRRGETIDESDLYLKAMAKFDDYIWTYELDYELIHNLVQKIIDKQASKNGQIQAKSYDEYFKHDFDCYLNQFWVIKDGLIGNGAKVSSVVSDLVHEENLRNNEKPLFSGEKNNQKSQLISEEQMKITNGRNIVDRLELEIGCKLEDLLDNIDLAAIDMQLEEIETNYLNLSNKQLEHEYKNLYQESEKGAFAELLSKESEYEFKKRFERWLAEKRYRKAYGDFGLISYKDEAGKWVTDEVENTKKRITTDVEIFLKQYFRDHECELVKNWMSENLAIKFKLSIDEIENVVKEYAGYIDNKNVYETEESWLVDLMLNKHPELSYEIWRIYRIIVAIYGISPDGIMPQNGTQNRICFWNYCLKSEEGKKTLTVLNSIINKYPTVLKVVIRMLMLGTFPELSTTIVLADTVLDKNNDESLQSPYAYGRMVNACVVRCKTETNYISREHNVLSKKLKDAKEELTKANLQNSLHAKFASMIDSYENGQGLFNDKECWFYEKTTGLYISDKTNSTARFSSPLLTAAMSVFIRNLSYYAKFSMQLEEQMTDMYSAYEEYCKMNNQLPAPIRKLLKDEGKEYKITPLYMKERFVEICNNAEHNDSYKKEYEKCIEDLKKLTNNYNEMCETLKNSEKNKVKSARTATAKPDAKLYQIKTAPKKDIERKNTDVRVATNVSHNDRRRVIYGGIPQSVRDAWESQRAKKE